MASSSQAEIMDAMRVERNGKNPVLVALSALASLKLTVVLFSFSMALVLFGTLAQDKAGIWDVVSDYFRSFFVYVPFNVFVPRQWFGGAWESVSGGFWFTGGKTIGAALFINLLAAHAIRFRIQASGARLAAGCVVIAIGTLLTLMVIVNGNYSDGIQDEPFFEWQTLWNAMIVGVGILWMVTAAAFFKVPAGQFLERILLLIGLLLITAALVWMVYLNITSRRLDDSSLRILWQLIQGTVAGGVLLAGCILAFKKRAGVVLLHAGVGLMMVNELLVAQFAKEEMIRVPEGGSAVIAFDIRTTEIAIIDHSDPEEDVVVSIPQEWLKPGSMISDELLPFDVFVERYDRNVFLQEKESPDPVAAVLNHANEPIEVTEGLGRAFDAMPQRPVAGADAGNSGNEAATYITLWPKSEKKSKPIATLLLSQRAHFSDIEEKVTYKDKEYSLVLRYSEILKPYRIELEDVERDTYVGTSTPKGFASDFQIVDSRTGNTLPAHISMNNPLRYGGETFYQSNYEEDQNGVEWSTFQVVTNDGWMIPYVSCMLVIIGMLAHFGMTLIKFLRRKDVDAPMLFGTTVAFIAAGWTGVRLWKEAVERQRRQAEFDAEKKAKLASFERKQNRDSAENAAIVERSDDAIGGIENYSMRTWVLVASVLTVSALYILSTYMRSPSGDDGVDYLEVGKIPVASEGRVLPFDSLARNTLRSIKRRETFEDLEGNELPATKWLLDVMVEAEAAQDYEVFRVADHELLALLKLPKKKSKNYSYRDVTASQEKFDKSVLEARETAGEDRSNFQKAVLDLARKLNTFETIQRIHAIPPSDPVEQIETDQLLKSIDLSGMILKNEGDLPLLVTAPKAEVESENDEESQADESAALGWESYYVGATRQWLLKQAEELDVSSSDQLASVLFEKVLPDEEEFLEQRIQILLFDSLREFIRQRNAGMTEQEIDDETIKYMASFTDDIRQQIRQRFEQTARQELQTVRGRFFDSIALVVGDSMSDDEVENAILENPSVSHWTDILRYYKAGETAATNEAVTEQLAYASAMDADDHSQSIVDFEAFYRRLSPLYLASVLYVLAGVVGVCAWIGWTRDLNRAAFWLLVFTLGIHTLGLVARMIISGRPPVTNLYSSAVFIGWGSVVLCLVLEMVFRIGIGNILASVMGFVCLMIAYALSIEEDTFKVVVAVLDTQFWLATHVVCVTLGYATTFVAGGLGIAYIVGGLVSKSFDGETRKLVSRMLYGMVCFSIFFSFFGTVLGGLWADDSWGRFWGWDPKENGALLIVIWNALLLHARWGGMVQARGMAMLAVFGNVVTTWSWFLVNQLGIGLHAYGFTKGVLELSFMFIGLQLFFIALAAIPTKYWASYR